MKQETKEKEAEPFVWKDRKEIKLFIKLLTDALMKNFALKKVVITADLYRIINEIFESSCII